MDNGGERTHIENGKEGGRDDKTYLSHQLEKNRLFSGPAPTFCSCHCALRNAKLVSAVFRFCDARLEKRFVPLTELRLRNALGRSEPSSSVLEPEPETEM